MSILNVNKINPVGGGSTITIAGIASVTGSVTAPSFVGNVTGNSDTASGLSGNPSINTTGIVTATSFVPTVGQLSHRNKVINGGMLINQRASSYTSTGGEYTLDRYSHASGGSFTFDTTTTQDSSTPDGFSKSLKITPDSTQTPTGTHNGTIRQVFEGQDFQDLAFGTSSAKSVTVSFYAKSSSQNNNHQYGVQLRCRDGSTTQYVSQAFNVTSSWQRFTMTFVGNTGVGIRNDTAVGFEICFHLASGPDDIVSAKSTWTTSTAFQTVTGQSNFMDNTSNEFYLTGVQLEVGSVATPFEHLRFGDDLRCCQRYYHRITAVGQYGRFANGQCTGSTESQYFVQFPVTMRAAPTFGYGGTIVGYTVDTVKTISGNITIGNANQNTGLLTASLSGLTAGNCVDLIANNDTTAYVEFIAEL